jgi:RNA polymerase sigma-70 factor (sigma-E family)
MISRRDGDAEFRDFARAAGPNLFRSAVLLTGDWHLAEDLVQDALARMYRIWPGIGRIDNPAAYAQTVLAHQFLSHRRRRSSGERPSDALPETAADSPDADLRIALIAALAQLPKRDRAVVVLRYLADRSVDQVAADLGRTPSAIKIQSMRALATLRSSLGDDFFESTRTDLTEGLVP